MTLAAVILAAGEGSRMKSDTPKVLHELAGAPLIAHVLATAAEAGAAPRVVVTGRGAAEVEAAVRTLDPEAPLARQAEQRGTADAVAAAREALAGHGGDVVVLYGDTPLVQAGTIARMQAARAAGAAVVVLGFEAADPGRYGRLVLDDEGRLARIVEAADATEAERAIRLCNSGVLLAPAPLLFELIGRIRPDNAAGEYYLTDAVALAREAGHEVAVVRCPEAETLGVNSRAELAAAEAAFQTRARQALLEAGVTLVAPETVFLAHDTVIGRDAVIEPHVIFGPGVTVETGARIRAFSHLEGCHVSAGAVIGPFARLRPGAEIGNDARIGNFVEVKNAVIGEGAKANHLAYIGDAEVGDGANIGAGTITCNYDGVMKHRTEIGPGAFIGSDTMLVAPVRIGAGAMTGSGSVITRDVPPGALAIERSEQVTRPGLAERLRERLRARKARQAAGEKETG